VPGILVGQIISGILGPRRGWREPFVVVALPGLLSAMLTYMYITEPARGQSENIIAVRVCVCV
jgi:predicted MFS family arabinose efflux permease